MSKKVTKLDVKMSQMTIQMPRELMSSPVTEQSILNQYSPSLYRGLYSGACLSNRTLIVSHY